MRIAGKLVIALAVILIASMIGKRQPALAGLIAVMLLTGLVVLVWLYMDNPGNFSMMAQFTKRRLLGNHSDNDVFHRRIFMFSQKPCAAVCALNKLCRLDYRCLCPSAAAA